MKKIISVLLSITMIIGTAIFTANAAEESSATVSADEFRFEELAVTTLTNNTLRSYVYGITAENSPRSSAEFAHEDTNVKYNLKLSDCLTKPQTITLEKGRYEATVCSGGNIYDRYVFEETGGVYVLTRFKLSDFSNYFNENGTHTKTYSDGFTHDFTFVDEHNKNSSSLVILSGGYLNFVAPDSDGYVQAYLCKNIGAVTRYFTDFRTQNGWLGGGISGSDLFYLNMGNTYPATVVAIADVTAIQKYVSEIEEFNNLQTRNADVNLDGKISIDDATMIQKYLAGLI